MSYVIDIALLKQALEKAPENKSEPDVIAPYLRKAVYEPLMRGESLTLGTIDYARFTLEDLHDMLDFAMERYKQADTLERFNAILCKRTPETKTGRTFC